ncbi:MAG: arylamine N-acetyltransferase [Bacteroidota bacterium]
MDIEKYLTRINYTGERKPSIEVLTALQKNHLLKVPFENLDIHYHQPIVLDINNFFDKIALRNRGGFCYELNGLFHSLLIALGFDAAIISARVYSKEEVYSPEYDHLAVLVKIDDKEYLTDVGFGEFAFSPLEINIGKIQHDQRGDFIVEKQEDDYYRASKSGNSQNIPEYIFMPVVRQLNEFAEMCQYHQTNPGSHFKQKALITMPTENGRITIADTCLKITESGNIINEKVLDDDEYKNCLKKYFNVVS